MPKRAHGHFDIYIFGHLVRVRAHMEWNEITAKAFISEYKEAVESLGDGEWASYFDLRNWGLAIPDAIGHLDGLADWRAVQGMGSHVFLLNGMAIQEALISRMVNLAPNKSYFFTQEDEVVDWLKKHSDLLPVDASYVENILQPFVSS